MFAEINLLVLEGDAAGLAAKVAELTSRRAGAVSCARAAPDAGNRIRGACAPHTLWRSMIALLLALSLSNKLLEVGALAAFAALVGIAVVSLLVFSQARELKRLREWAGRAPERAADRERRCAPSGPCSRWFPVPRR